MFDFTQSDLWPARAPRRLFANPSGTRAAQRRLNRAASRRSRRGRAYGAGARIR